MMSMSLSSISEIVGFTLNSPSIRPTRTPPTRLGERNVREIHGGGGADQCEDVGVVLLVGGHDRRHDLGLVRELLREERPDRPIDEPRAEHFFLGRPSLALEEAARNLAAA